MSVPSVPADVIAIAPDAAQAPPAPAASTCAGCGRELLGDFCHACGERRLRADEMTLRAFVRDVASEVADLDSRAYRSARALLTRPGFLTAEWVAGRRRAYVGPLKLFLISFAAILLASSLRPRAPLEESARTLDGSWMGGMADALAARAGLSRVETLERLNSITLSHLSWLSVLIPVVLAAVLVLVFKRRRRGYVEHLVFATHVSTVYFVLGIAVMPVQSLMKTQPLVAQALSVLVLGVMWVYVWRAVTCVYGDRGWRAGLRAAVVLVGINLGQGVAGLLAFGTATLSLLYL